jgi:hypothetical protein
MLFDSEHDALKWYESEDRALSKDFLHEIPWQDVKKHPLNPSLIPIITYMRDVEQFTDIYYQQLLRSPTAKDPVVKKFMDRWAHEELLHAELLNRFLGEAGLPDDPNWKEKAKRNIPMSYHLMSRVQTLLTGCFGKAFSAVHMTWGAINEYSTMTGYTRLIQLADHPVLEFILRGINREEGRHSFFYWSIARLKLLHSQFRRGLSRFIVEKFWGPVGSGAKPEKDVNLVIKTLFKGKEGVDIMHRMVNFRI